MKVAVQSCTRRRDDKYLIGFRMPGGGIGAAVSDEPVQVGKDAIVRDGKAVPA